MYFNSLHCCNSSAHSYFHLNCLTTIVTLCQLIPVAIVEVLSRLWNLPTSEPSGSRSCHAQTTSSVSSWVNPTTPGNGKYRYKNGVETKLRSHVQQQPMEDFLLQSLHQPTFLSSLLNIHLAGSSDLYSSQKGNANGISEVSALLQYKN
ncbi:hypothetical protein BYT27DRAFT_6875598 [Phlegmacium glaucopus]|nr:hypothetical protein BYT27DRAFT_6875598 [Phlegmacium glaucopus]